MKLNVGPGTNIHRIAEQALQLLHLPPSDADDTVSFTFNDTLVVVTWADESSEDVIARYYEARVPPLRYRVERTTGIVWKHAHDADTHPNDELEPPSQSHPLKVLSAMYGDRQTARIQRQRCNA